MLVSIASFGQKKQIQTAEEQLKKGKELVKVEKAMELLLKDSANRTNSKIWLFLCEALIKQYDQGKAKIRYYSFL